MAAARPKPGLGRGLSSLLGEADGAATPAAPAAAAPAGPPRTLPIERIRPMPGQPRQRFDPEAMAELVASVREQGVLTPLIVRPKDGHYELIAGERRWRAAQQAQLHELPVVVREMDDAAALQAAIVENTQRADLNAIEEARGYQRLRDEFGHSVEAIGRMVAKSRSHVSNLIRLLDLPADVRTLVETGTLSAGHARALIGQPNAADLARQAIERGLSVRDVEIIVAATRDQPAARSVGGGPGAAGRSPAGRFAATEHRDPDMVALEKRLSDALGMGVQIAAIGKGDNALMLFWSNLDQLDLLVRRLTGGRV